MLLGLPAGHGCHHRASGSSQGWQHDALDHTEPDVEGLERRTVVHAHPAVQGFVDPVSAPQAVVDPCRRLGELAIGLSTNRNDLGRGACSLEASVLGEPLKLGADLHRCLRQRIEVVGIRAARVYHLLEQLRHREQSFIGEVDIGGP
ncbi:MAG: hypothetical protein KDK70_38700 [Myxococcales bacterium]|nr:hypothetical protein [Myxococcales bacterium]